MRPIASAFAIVVLGMVLGACGRSEEAASTTGAGADSSEPLPAPAGAAGGVTGMPAKPGPGPVGPPEPAPAVALDAEGNPVLPDGVPTAVPGALPGAVPGAHPGAAPVPGDPVSPEAGPAEAVSVVRDYYAAINRGDFDRAYALWAEGGRASGQSAQQFAAGFADTTGISVEVLAPGPMQAAAGSRRVEVPVAFTTRLRDGTQRRFVGAYVLQRAVVDGATPEQAAWRIASADLRAVAP